MQLKHYFPIFVDLSNFRVLVVGGGKIGSKRALEFRKYGAKVDVLSLSFSDELYNSGINLINSDARNVNSNDLQKYDIIITCTSDFNLNKELCDLAKSLGKLCNNPTNVEDSNFIVPIFYSDENYEIAITTRGKSSILAKEILSQITKQLRENMEIKNLLDAMYNVKLMLKDNIKDSSVRFSLYHVIYNDSIFRSYASKGNLEYALKRAEEIINAYKQ
ncbi:bifunctional precorrin-2 dehydrogenase/sirohydrochlorin ferrochelatase [Sulfolobus sp. B1]|uniref:precorrin-2 dehydrogenase/sirohydrochlorin ferrochelatase family protein n=1 Tax=Sulfolobaceae TaxID=118883 RepID=UPI0008462119|nr:MULTISPECIES: bifunctional precorrin-2 dehydrogenase/sirohydrochlorin ferrochelatase [unclassified Sulfolobus]TRM74310.1 bifunctional precorrin-2 dehydrogenase/sirohydrochlorin ferrochelatase [Sulfolobus sp. A20-N-F8]TRM75267.1 bifunctional precorrin-2 dehydrogenase/sirohydrochlorin ferrochelatase [Sulfolobus sp. B5]TRM82563.1 bifunctional precorrin-2 dehydrogenase/sirohydrochlorin ferrochelatase [Sulfolobus sp. D5]TRM86298.1 bifunctional precorrin-2 dehydrogenase/sirohydrochlorin ferrochela